MMRKGLKSCYSETPNRAFFLQKLSYPHHAPASFLLEFLFNPLVLVTGTMKPRYDIPCVLHTEETSLNVLAVDPEHRSWMLLTLADRTIQPPEPFRRWVPDSSYPVTITLTSFFFFVNAPAPLGSWASNIRQNFRSPPCEASWLHPPRQPRLPPCACHLEDPQLLER